MSKELFTIDPYKGEPLDDFALKADPRHDPAGTWTEKMAKAEEEGDVRSWIFFAMCRLRRLRGKCSKADGFDCVLEFSEPLPASGGKDDPAPGVILAAGFDDMRLGTEESVKLLWEDSRRERRWTPVQDFRMSRLQSLKEELEKFFRDVA